MISVILILVLAVYQQILSSTEQGFMDCYEKTELGFATFEISLTQALLCPLKDG